MLSLVTGGKSIGLSVLTSPKVVDAPPPLTPSVPLLPSPGEGQVRQEV